MHIELLWIVPILALALFLIFMTLYFQRRMGYPARTADLHREVDLFNAGQGSMKWRK
jgi:cytochrome c-type biogenesis protein CcmH/NrfF